MKLYMAMVLLVCGLSAFAELPHPEAPFAAMTPAEVKAYELDVMRRVGDLSLIPPVINTSPLPKYDYDQLNYGMIIGMARTPGGRLWAAWVGGEDGPKAFMLAATSDDNGETWSKPRLVIDSQSPSIPLPRSVIVGNFWTDPLGRLWLFFDQTMNHYDGRSGLWVSICENPDAENPVWSGPKRIWNGSVLNKPTVLSNGEWLLPVQFTQHPGVGPMKDVFKELEPLRGANVFVSNDQGATWNRRGICRFPSPSWPEHMLVELGDGRIWMLARTDLGTMQSFSSDGGRTWAEPSFPTFKHPAARFHIRRLASGRILLVKHGETIDSYDSTHGGRTKLTAWLSDDEGKTWQGGLMLDERTGISYPDGFQSPDGTIYVSYDRNRASDGEILMARITEDDILAKQPVSPGSKLKMLICRPLKGRTASAGPNPATTAEAQAFIAGPAAELDAPGGEIRKLEKNAVIYSNRAYTFHEVPAVLGGKRFVFSTLERTEVVCRKEGVVYAVTPSPQRNPDDNAEAELLRQGFAKAAVPEFVICQTQGKNRPQETCSVYQKILKPGEIVRFGRWGVVIF